MATPTFPTADWSGATMLAFRRDYVRDLVDTGVYLSFYNRATKAQFLDDPSINAIKSRVETDFAEELANVYASKLFERTSAGDDATTADVNATTVLLDTTMRLVRAECFERQMMDPGFVGSVADEKQRANLFQTWAVQIERDRTFERGRAGVLGAIPLQRF